MFFGRYDAPLIELYIFSHKIYNKIYIIPTAFTAGGNKEADMATPTSEAVYSPKTARATPAPLGIATKTPTHSDRISHLLKKSNTRINTFFLNVDIVDKYKKTLSGILGLYIHFPTLGKRRINELKTVNEILNFGQTLLKKDVVIKSVYSFV